MSVHASFDELMARLLAGDQSAASQVFNLFTHRLIALARSRLDSQIRGKVDPEDVAQSVWRSFFLRQAEGEFDLADWNSLWGLLVVITLRKCGRQIEHFRAARRDLKREATPPHPTDSSHTGWEAVAREPTPSEAAILTETVEQLMLELRDDRERQILSLSLQGVRVSAISTQVGLTERTVERVRERVRKRLEQMRDEREHD